MLRRPRSSLSLVAAVAALVLTGGTGCSRPSTSSSTAPTETRQSSPASTSPSQPRPTGSTASSRPTKPTVSPSTSAKSGTPTRSATPASGCGRLAASLTLNEQVGQLFMIGIGSGGPSTDEASTLAEAHAGSVILLGNTQAGSTAVKDVTRAVRRVVAAPHGIQVMLAADQEGGLVQRLQGSGFDRIPSALDQAQLSDSRLTRDAESWGEQLHRAGIDADLAPVADVVPASLLNVNQPIGRLRRGYGSDPRTVAAKVTAFTTGMDRAGIATSVKHFPGLGRVRGNTDFATRVVDSTTTRHDPALRGFAAGVRAGVDMVMVSSATYSRIDPDHPGPYSRTIIEGMIRQDLRFRGVVISDDLAGKAVSGLSPGQRALRFLDAGGDLVIMGDPGLAPAMVRAVRAEARDDPEFAARLTTKVTRVLTMKERRGLADCG